MTARTWKAASRISLTILIAFAVFAPLVWCAGVNAATAEQVNSALEKAKAFVLSQQKPDGSWEVPTMPQHPEQVGGQTALVMDGLLSAGVDSKDPAMVKGIKYLQDVTMRGTYPIGLRAQVWLQLPYDDFSRKMVKRDAMLLLDGMKDHDVKGLFHYSPLPGDSGYPGYDHSNSQYGVLGLWAAAEMNLEMKDEVWIEMDKAWRSHQNPDGGWGYGFSTAQNSTATMTSAGVATLFVMQEMLHGNDGVNCSGNIFDPAIEKGLDWMSKAMGTGQVNFQDKYLLYGMERIGVASGRKYFGSTDWYKAGADYLVGSQKGDASWDSTYPSSYAGPAGCTAFCLLFLSRGRAPVMMNKLEYGLDDHGKSTVANWNERPRDLAHLAKWGGKQCETLLNWQVVNLKVPVEDLHDAPILYISGNQTLAFTQEEMAKLRLFVEQGGMILGNADCGNPAFAESFKKLGGKLFESYEFATVPTSHIMLNEQFRADKWKTKPHLEALSNGARVLMVLYPNADPARYLQTSSRGGHDELWESMQDIFLYSVDQKGIREKGNTYIVTPYAGVTAGTSIKVARLAYTGNWDPEPGGWRRLAAVMHNQCHTELAIERVDLGAGKLDSSYKVAHLTGTAAFHLNDAARAEIKKFVQDGGTLVVDTAGGSGDFQDSASKELATIFTDAKPQLLKLAHPVFAVPEKIGAVGYRNFARKVLGRISSPRLHGIDINGHTAIFVSGEDLSVGLVGQEVDGVYGYTPKSATEIMRNILIYATGQRPTGTTAPTSGTAQ